MSFWARHRDGTGSFAGRDEWLFDSRWHKLTFRFCATDPDQRTLVYVSLLPNQRPVETTVLLDDFELTVADALAEIESRRGNLAVDPGFEAQRPGRIVPPWSFANMGGTNISAGIGGNEAGQWINLRMPAGTTNFESAQLWQYLELRRGVRYDISGRMRWDDFAPEVQAPIVNYGIYHEASRTWYGPVDQVLERNAEWNTYRFAHIPPIGGRWKRLGRRTNMHTARMRLMWLSMAFALSAVATASEDATKPAGATVQVAHLPFLAWVSLQRLHLSAQRRTRGDQRLLCINPNSGH